MSQEIASLEDIVRVHGRDRGDQPICTYDGRSLSYAEMDRRSSRIANALLAAGMRVDDRVAFIGKNSCAFFEVLFGVRKAGGILVPVNWRLSAEEMGYILDNSYSDIVFVERAYQPGLARVIAAWKVQPKLIVLADGELPESWLAAHGDADPGGRSSPEDIALQLYTSGTTGRPKGAMLMNRSIVAFIDAARGIFGLDPDARHLNCLPLFHVGGINWALQAMAQGAHCIGFRDFDPVRTLRAIGEERATHLMTVPAVIQMLVDNDGVNQGNYASLRAIVYGGSTIPERVIRDAVRIFGCGFYGMYGATELSFGNTLLTPEEHDFERYPDLVTSCGRPFDGSSAKIIDPATGAELPEGEVGEVWIFSPQRAKGYWNRPEATADVFLADGWYRTGDVGALRGGYLHLSDRLNDMIVSGGENVYPAEVERVLHEHPGVAEASAFGVPDAQWGESVAAAVVARPEAPFDEAELIAFVRQRLAHYKCPKHIIQRTELPRTASGKVQRHVLREPFWAGSERRIN